MFGNILSFFLTAKDWFADFPLSNLHITQRLNINKIKDPSPSFETLQKDLFFVLSIRLVSQTTPDDFDNCVVSLRISLS